MKDRLKQLKIEERKAYAKLQKANEEWLAKILSLRGYELALKMDIELLEELDNLNKRKSK